VRLPEVRSLEAVTDDSRVDKQVNRDPATSRINSEITNVRTDERFAVKGAIQEVAADGKVTLGEPNI
jgi:hypothetical protein